MKKILIPLLALAFAACGTQPTNTNDNNLSQMTQELIFSRRSIRQYTSQPISRDTLQQILNCGINAPSGRNLQAYEVRVVDNAEMLKNISAAVLLDNPDERNTNGSIFFDSKCVVFLAHDTSYDMSQVDCGLLGENIVLSAWSMGIGSCCVAHPVRMMKESPSCAPYIKQLGFSEGYNLLYGIVLGYPAEKPDARPRRNDKVQFIN